MQCGLVCWQTGSIESSLKAAAAELKAVVVVEAAEERIAAVETAAVDVEAETMIVGTRVGGTQLSCRVLIASYKFCIFSCGQEQESKDGRKCSGCGRLEREKFHCLLPRPLLLLLLRPVLPRYCCYCCGGCDCCSTCCCGYLILIIQLVHIASGSVVVENAQLERRNWSNCQIEGNTLSLASI